MNKFMFIATALISALLVSCGGGATDTTVEKKGYTDKEAIENIFARKSVRSFLDQPVEQEKIDLIIRAGMAAPSGMDKRPWEVFVVNDRDHMDDLMVALPYAKMLAEAPLAMVVCGNKELQSYWYIDCSAMVQNMLLAAEALDLGAVWTGVYPNEERVKAVSEIMELPEHIVPLAVIPIGYPKGEQKAKDKYDKTKVHYKFSIKEVVTIKLP